MANSLMLSQNYTISQKLQLHTVAPIKTRGKITLLKETKAIRGLYEARGFCDMHADQEFTFIQQEILPTNLNIADADNQYGRSRREYSVYLIKYHSILYPE